MWAASDSSASEEASTPATTSTSMKHDDQRQRRLQRAALGVRGRGVAVRMVSVRRAATQFTDGSAASARPARSCRPCASAPPPTARAGSSVNASSRRAGSRIQSPRSSSASSWPGPQPAWPTNARPRRTPAPARRRTAPSPSTPMSSKAISAASLGVLELGQHDQRRGLHRAADVQRVVDVEQLRRARTRPRRRSSPTGG